MKCFRRFAVLILCSMLTTSCGDPNLFTEYSQQETDEAFFIDAQKKIDSLQWNAAIDIINNKMSANYRQKVKVKEALAGAYAGKCGFTFADVLAGLQNNPSSRIFPFFMSIFAGLTLDTASCDSAITVMESIGGVLDRTADQNLFMSILGLARIGTVLSAKLDRPIADGTPDGVYKTDYNVCHNYSAGVATDGWPGNVPYAPEPVAAPTRFITDTEAKKVASGIGLLFENMSALGSVLSGGNSTLTGLQSALTQCESVAGASNCTQTNPNNVSATLLYATRVLLDEGQMGFGSCVVGSVTPGQICCQGLRIPGM